MSWDVDALVGAPFGVVEVRLNPEKYRAVPLVGGEHSRRYSRFSHTWLRRIRKDLRVIPYSGDGPLMASERS